MKHILSIYHISVYERRRKENRARLNDVNGIDLIDLIDDFITAWLRGTASLQKAEAAKKACKLSEELGHQLYYRRGRIIDGIIESGEYGQEIDVYDVRNSQKSTTIKKHHAPLLPFYFLFYIPDESYDGYLILQKNGNNGIFSILTAKFLEYARDNLVGDYTINISAFVSSSLRDDTWKSVTYAKSLIINKKQTIDILESLGLGSLEEQGVKCEVKYTLPKGRVFQIPNNIKNIFNRGEQKVFAETPEDEKAIKEDDISMEVIMPDGTPRTISMATINSLGTSVVLPEDCARNNKEFPTFGVLKSEAMRLIELITTRKNGLEKKK